MPETPKNILLLPSNDTLDFFMRLEQFYGFELISKLYDKLCKQHNSDYYLLWLQNITYTQNKKRNKSPYTMRLCQFVMGESYEPLWNKEWLNSELSSKLPYDLIVNKEI